LSSLSYLLFRDFSSFVLSLKSSTLCNIWCLIHQWLTFPFFSLFSFESMRAAFSILISCLRHCCYLLSTSLPLTCRSLRAASVSAITTVSLETTLAYVKHLQEFLSDGHLPLVLILAETIQLHIKNHMTVHLLVSRRWFLPFLKDIKSNSDCLHLFYNSIRPVITYNLGINFKTCFAV
jgi:hypothetical protein